MSLSLVMPGAETWAVFGIHCWPNNIPRRELMVRVPIGAPIGSDIGPCTSKISFNTVGVSSVPPQHMPQSKLQPPVQHPLQLHERQPQLAQHAPHPLVQEPQMQSQPHPAPFFRIVNDSVSFPTSLRKDIINMSEPSLHSSHAVRQPSQHRKGFSK